MTSPGSVDDRIADSTLDLLRTGGPRAVTVEAVRAHSGIAKTTIYRRHRDRREMLTAALARLISPAPESLGDDPADRLRWLISQATSAVSIGIGVGGFASLLTEEDPVFTAVFRKVLIDQRAALIKVIDQAKDDGVMRSDVDPDTLIDAIVGSYIAERARTGQLGEDWDDRLFVLFWPLMIPR